MPLKLTPDIFDNLWAEAELQGDVVWTETEQDESVRATLQQIGKVQEYGIDLQAGLSLDIRSWELLEDLAHGDDDGGDEDGVDVNFTYHLSGKVQTNLHGLTGEIEEVVGYHNLSNCAGVRETEIWLAGTPFQRVYLHLDPMQLFGNLTGDSWAQLPVEIQRSIDGQHRPYYRSNVTTPAMQQAIEQILHCPYEGLLKRMYLQSKAWELITLEFEQYQSAPSLQIGQIGAGDIERIHRAKEILLQQLDNPPSLEELARLVELNECALKKGFRQVFGTTAFQYLHDYRLEQARQLIEQRDRSIAAVGKCVGFNNRGYFAAAFRKKFGLSPKAYQLARKNSG